MPVFDPEMTQNIYDDPSFFHAYSQMARSVQGLAGAPEWPALRAMLPPLRGLRVVDLGCGYGWFCRWAAEQGASGVLGLDVSYKMLDRARSLSGASLNHPAIAYAKADLENLVIPTASFDLAYSSLAFHYIEDLRGLLDKIYLALTPGASLVFSIEHPIFMAPRHPDWIVDLNGHKSWPVDHYQQEGPRVTHWLADGVVKQHRTMGTLLNHLIAAGFAITHVQEWGPTEEDIALRPELSDERERPMMLLVSARR